MAQFAYYVLVGIKVLHMMVWEPGNQVISCNIKTWLIVSPELIPWALYWWKKENIFQMTPSSHGPILLPNISSDTMPLTLPRPILLTPARSSMRLRCGGSGGFGWVGAKMPPIFLIGWGLTWSHKGPPRLIWAVKPKFSKKNQKNSSRGQNGEGQKNGPTGVGIRTSPEPHRSRIELHAGVKSIGLGNVRDPMRPLCVDRNHNEDVITTILTINTSARSCG